MSCNRVGELVVCGRYVGASVEDLSVSRVAGGSVENLSVSQWSVCWWRTCQ